MNRLDELENAIKNAEESITNLRNELEELKKNPESAIPENVEDIPKAYPLEDYVRHGVMNNRIHRFVYRISYYGEETERKVLSEENIANNTMLFPNCKFAEMFREKAQFIADCLLFKWLYDRDYVPVWDGYKNNYCVVYQRSEKRYVTGCYNNLRHDAAVYFSNKDIAEKCTEWLNYRKGNEK